MTTRHLSSMVTLVFIASVCMLLLLTPSAAVQVWLAWGDEPQSTTSQSPGHIDPAEFEAFLDSYLAEQMKAHHIPGVVFSMVKNGEVFFSKGYGYADLEYQTPFDPDETVLTTASLAKAFTALGVLQLYEKGIIDLHEDVRPYFTEFQLLTTFPEPLTFANLLTHTLRLA
jgi:CubicO group peptidase (beta-lactamase class C family)